MKITMIDCRMVIMLLLFFHISNAQDWKINIKDHCNNDLGCNPFLSGVTCGTAVIRTTHGSPSYYISGTSKRIALQASSSSGGTQYGEGFTVEYAFQTGKTYTVKIVHQGLPQTGAVSFPRLIATLTNHPPRNNDGCSQGHFNSSNFYTYFEFIVSPGENTSSFTVTPTESIAFLWLRSLQTQMADAGLLISNIEIDDHSVSNPGSPGSGGPYPCSGEVYHFCDSWRHVNGNWEVRSTPPIRISCDAFTSESTPTNTFFFRRFASATEISLEPGFVASAYPNAQGQTRLFFAMGSSDPCNEDMSVHTSYVTKPSLHDFVVNKLQDQRKESPNISVYPTITGGDIRVDGHIKELGSAAISVLDQSGRVVYLKTGQSANTPLELNLGHLSNGLYFVRISSNSKVIVKKIIIKK